MAEIIPFPQRPAPKPDLPTALTEANRLFMRVAFGEDPLIERVCEVFEAHCRRVLGTTPDGAA